MVNSDLEVTLLLGVSSSGQLLENLLFLDRCALACSHICFRRKLMIKEDRLLVSDFINEGGNVFIPGLDAATAFLNNVSRCVC